jgi:hypothetical protein
MNSKNNDGIVKHHGITKESIDEVVLPQRVSELIHKFLK